MKNASSPAREQELLRDFEIEEAAEEGYEPVDSRFRDERGMWARLFDRAVRTHALALSPRTAG